MKELKLLKIARAYLRQAEARLKDAKEVLAEGIYPYAARLNRECVEMSLRAVLKAVGIEYPKVHDVSDVLVDVKERFPEWFRAELQFLCQSSKALAKKREISLYGGETFLSPEEVISKVDAEDAVQRADKTYGLCKKFVDSVSAG